jgi:hypothetical protein
MPYGLAVIGHSSNILDLENVTTVLDIDTTTTTIKTIHHRLIKHCISQLTG